MSQPQYMQLRQVDWKPEFSKARNENSEKKYGKTWKAWGDDCKHMPVFEIGVHDGDYFSENKPRIEATKHHAGGIGSVWSLDLEATDKLIVMLGEAREELLKRLGCKHGSKR